jgi:lipid II isoglutaminyl synthase (glutamine-hydrolysing)
VSCLVIVHLYPRLLRTYGDRGNVLALARRAEWRGFDVRIDDVDIGEPLPSDANLVLLGGGTDRVQGIIGADLAGRRRELADAAARGAVILGICGGYQLLGRHYVTPEGDAIEGLGLLDVQTVASDRRIIGRVHARARLWGHEFDMVGFENHGGRTTLGPSAEPLASVVRGGGNDGRDGTEGAVQGTVVGTYLHGPAIPVNPEFADTILARALRPVTGGAPLAPLDDAAERRAHDEAVHQLSVVPPRRRRLVALGTAALLLMGIAGRAAAAEIDDDEGRPPAHTATCMRPDQHAVPNDGAVTWQIRSRASACPSS